MTSSFNLYNADIASMMRGVMRIHFGADFTGPENPFFSLGSRSGRQIRMEAQSGDVNSGAIRRLKNRRSCPAANFAAIDSDGYFFCHVATIAPFSHARTQGMSFPS
jgi:hypothetical protein